MKEPNRLKHEVSPYLLQHANNPVDWFAWNDDAFSRARETGKPIFLSIGYSTCHWCHVMAHECFEDEEVARLMNDTFVCIKVDREELPHIDAIYMNICQIMTGSGGWPLTIIMTPEKKPLFAATYLPKHSRHGLIGMTDLIPKIAGIWRTKREDAEIAAENISRMVEGMLAQETRGETGEYLVHDTFSALARRYDSEHGGFGHAPKFPSPHVIMFLLRYYNRTGNSRALSMAEKTLSSMSMGGIYDHIGYGFHRYSTDERWLVPHFEKMLYDQAMLAIAYTEAFLATAKEHYKKTAQDTLRYVLRDMVSPDGFFCSAEDADSQGMEGVFYLWKDTELRSVLDKDDYLIAARIYSVHESGNFSPDELHGVNILHMSAEPGRVAAELGMDEHSLRQRLERIEHTLFRQRSLRPVPFRDDKALTDWNGLMIAALARAHQAFQVPDYLAAAEKAASFVLRHMTGPQGVLMHTYRGDRASGEATADDYAFFVWGLIELFQATFNPQYLEAALMLTDTCMNHFMDRSHGGFFLTPDHAQVVIARTKTSYDSALPSGNSVLALNLARLSKITGDTGFEHRAHDTIRAFAAGIARTPDAYTFMMCALDFLLGPAHEVVISGDRQNPDTKEMIRALRSRFLPNVTVMLRPGQDTPELRENLKGKESISGRATAYVCSNRSCLEPTTDISEMIDLLSVPQKHIP